MAWAAVASSGGVARCGAGVQRGGALGSPRRLGRNLRTIWSRVAGNRSNGGSGSEGGAGGGRSFNGGGAVHRGLATVCSASPRVGAASGAEPTGPRVCILGGGFGGLYTAVKLESLMWPRGTKPRVTLIDQSERFSFKPLLYELLSGAASDTEVAPPFAQLLAPYPVAFVQGRVASVRLDDEAQDGAGGGVVVLADGASVPYDWLVVSLGAETSTFGIPGVRQCALPFSTYQDAQRVNDRLAVLERALSYPEVVVVGGGYAGVELAAAVADRLKGRARVKLVTSGRDILEGSPQGNRETARRVLQDQGVSILTGAQVTEMRMAGSGGNGNGGGGGDGGDDLTKRLVLLRDSEGQQEILEADLVLWSAGQAPVSQSAAAAADQRSGPVLPFATNARGALQTDATLRALNHRRVFALGDIAVSSGGREQPALPATAQVAFQQADYVAWNLWASINSKPLLSFSYQHLGDMMSLGAASGAVTLPIPVPPPLSAAASGSGPLGTLLRAAGVKLSGSYGGASDGVTLEGPLAAAVRRAAYLYRQPTLEQQVRVAGGWAKQLTSVLAAAAGRPTSR